MLTKIKLFPGDELKHVGSRSKGSIAQTYTDKYSIVNFAGEITGSVIHESHTERNGTKRNQHVTQTDKNGKVIVQETW